MRLRNQEGTSSGVLSSHTLAGLALVEPTPTRLQHRNELYKCARWLIQNTWRANSELLRLRKEGISYETFVSPRGTHVDFVSLNGHP